ncbi:MAG: hypothetical protein ACXWLT_01005 [Rhizomicrobium sp.]
MSGNVLDIPCTLEIEQTADSFHAHLVLDGDIAIHPGDRVLVHGEPVRMAFGEKLSERRRATLTRAGLLRRAWTRFAARFALQDLYEVSFTPRRTL